jgi:hypothetical protein
MVAGKLHSRRFERPKLPDSGHGNERFVARRPISGLIFGEHGGFWGQE